MLSFIASTKKRYNAADLINIIAGKVRLICRADREDEAIYVV